jgi:hypothetical protein
MTRGDQRGELGREQLGPMRLESQLMKATICGSADRLQNALLVFHRREKLRLTGPENTIAVLIMLLYLYPVTLLPRIKRSSYLFPLRIKKSVVVTLEESTDLTPEICFKVEAKIQGED